MDHDRYVPLDEAIGDERVIPFFDRSGGFQPDQSPAPPARIIASPFLAKDPKTIPPRRWLYGRHYVRGHASATIAPGGVGKTSLSFVEAVSMVSGRALLGGAPPKQVRVWLWNLEDPLDEMERRLAAILLHFQVDAGEVGGLFVDSGRTSPLLLASKLRDQVVVAEPVVDALIQEIRERQIDVVIIDPFVSSHAVPENDNGAIDRVVKTWARVADATGHAPSS